MIEKMKIQTHRGRPVTGPDGHRVVSVKAAKVITKPVFMLWNAVQTSKRTKWFCEHVCAVISRIYHG